MVEGYQQRYIAEKVQYLVDKDKGKDVYTEAIDAKCIDIKIHVESPNEDSKQKTENAIRFAIQNLLKGKPSEIKIKTIDTLVEQMAKDGTEIVNERNGSVLLKVKCISLKGITNLLVLTESEELRKEMEDELSKTIDKNIRLGCGITEESKQTIIDDLDRIKTEYETKKPMVIRYIDSDSLIQNTADIAPSEIEEDSTTETPSQPFQAEALTGVVTPYTSQNEDAIGTIQTDELQQQICGTITDEAREMNVSLDNEDVLMENARLLKDIRKYTRLQKYVKPRCLLISTVGQGKSASINTLKSIFAGEYHHMVSYGRGIMQAKTLSLSKYENYGIVRDDYPTFDSDEDENLEELNDCLPTLIDLAGFENINSEENREILDLIIAGKIPFGLTVTALQYLQNDHGVCNLSRVFRTVDPDRKVDKIIFMHACNEPAIPNHLIQCLNAVITRMDEQTGRLKYDVDVVALITKYDRVVFERSKVGGKTIPNETTQDYSNITMQEYRTLDIELAKLLNIEGDLENNRFPWVNFCDDVGYDTNDTNIANNVYKLTRRLVSPMVEDDSKPEPIIDLPTYSSQVSRSLGQICLYLSRAACMASVAIVLVVFAILWALYMNNT